MQPEQLLGQPDAASQRECLDTDDRFEGRSDRSPKNRMLAVLNGSIPDQVPAHYRATQEVTEQLLGYFKTNNFNVVRQELGISGWRNVNPVYVGPKTSCSLDGVRQSCWGTLYKKVNYGMGVYYERFHYPLADASTASDLNKFAWPQADWWDFSSFPKVLAEQDDDHVVVMGGHYSLFEKFADLKPLEKCLICMLTEPDFVHDVFRHLHRYWMQRSEAIFQAGNGRVRMTMISDDVGMQDRMMMRPEVWREFFPPLYREFIEMAHRYGVKVLFHSDGAIDDIIPDLIDLGVDVLDPVQHECPGMSLKHLKNTYGSHLTFSGAVDNQKVLSYGSVEEVKEETRNCLRVLAKGGGYILSSCHRIQPISPIENVLAMFQVVQEEGDKYF